MPRFRLQVFDFLMYTYGRRRVEIEENVRKLKIASVTGSGEEEDKIQVFPANVEWKKDKCVESEKVSN